MELFFSHQDDEDFHILPTVNMSKEVTGRNSTNYTAEESSLGIGQLLENRTVVVEEGNSLSQIHIPSGIFLRIQEFIATVALQIILGKYLNILSK